MSTSNQKPSWLGQVQQFPSAATVVGGADDVVIGDPAAVSTALGAIAAGMSPASDSPLSLGDQLRRNAAAQADHEKRAKDAEQARLDREQAESLSRVRAFFMAAWFEFTTNIDSGVAPGKVKLDGDVAALLRTYQWALPVGEAWQTGGRGIWNQPAHPYVRQWVEFVVGCRENGLEPVWAYEHDGAGLRSWWVLTVVAYEAASEPAASGDILDDIGCTLGESRLDDSRGARLLIRDALAQGEFALAARMLGCDEEFARKLWQGRWVG